AAAVIEFNSLPYTVRTTPEDDHLLLLARRGLVFFFIGRVEIGREALKLGGTSVHTLVNRRDAKLLAHLADLLRAGATAIHAPDICQAAIGEAHALGIADQLRRRQIRRRFLQLRLHVVDLF